MKIRKAILTGGGHATRLRPITATINKHLLPLANKPMIFHAIEKVVEAGVKEIFINTNPGETSLQERIGDGGHWGINITYFEQTGGPQGIAHVVNEAKKFIGNDPFIFYLSDNILLAGVKDLVEEFESNNYDCMLTVSKVKDPERFGVPVFDDNGKLIDAIEKPTKAPNDFAITGIYLYGANVFFEAFENIKKSDRGEYEISSIHSLLLKQGKKVGYKEITGWWRDTGKPDDLLLANKLLLDAMGEENFFISHSGNNPKITGNVHVGIGTQIREGVEIVGPVMIAENCVLENCKIGPYVTLGTSGEFRGVKISNSIILEDTEIICDAQITNSLIGKKVIIGDDKERTKDGHEVILGDGSVTRL